MRELMGNIIDAGSAVATAAATGVVAWFTVVLARSAKEASNNYRAVERAFVFMQDLPEQMAYENEPITMQVGHATMDGIAKVPVMFFYEPRWENSGTTPTRKMIVCTNWTHQAGDLAPDFAYEDGKPETMFLGPRSIMPSNVICIPPDVIRAAIADETRIYIWGRTEYEDIFGQSHWMRFCYRLHVEDIRAERFGWRHRTTYGRYNGTDQDQSPNRKRKRMFHFA